MKKALLLILSILILCVGAYADLTVTDVTVGGPNQERGVTASATFTVTNTGTLSVDVTSVVSNADATKYAAAFDATTFTLAPSALKTVTVTAKVPNDFNAVDTDLTAKAFEVGTITVTGTENSTTKTGTSKLKMQAENELNVKKVKVTVKGVAGTSTDTFRDGGKLDDVKPGDDLTLEVEVENTFPSSGTRETDFDDVEVTLAFADDSDFDVDEDEDDFSLGSNDEDTAKFAFTVADDARDKDHAMTFSARALDENGARHGAVLTATLSVERDSHDLVLKKAELSPAKLVCGATRTVTFNGEVLNRGRLDEDEAVVELRVPSLGVTQKTSSFELEEDEVESVKLKFDVDSKVSGTFEGELITYYDLTKTNNVRLVSLAVDDCKEEVKLPEPVTPKPAEPKEEAVVTPVVQVPPGVVTQPGQAVTQGVPPARVTSAFRESNNYMLLLAVASAVILVLIVALLAATVRRR